MSPASPSKRSKFHLIPAEVFCTSLCINARNAKLSDAEFRAFVLNSLSIVDFPSPSACMGRGCPQDAPDGGDKSGG